jgi:hypothetical protein
LPWEIKPNWIFAQADIDLARSRLTSMKRKGTTKGGLRPKALLKIVSTWHIWVFTAVYSCYIFSQSESRAFNYLYYADNGVDPQQSMSFWLKMSKSPTYSVEQIN